jgi:hypothetical protein
MTTRLILLLAAALLCWAAPLQGQTIKALSYDTTNGIVIAGTNRVQFTNRVSVPAGGGTNDLTLRLGTNNTGFYVLTSAGTPVGFVHNDVLSFAVSTAAFALYKPLSFVAATNADATRTNLGLPLPALTNASNVTVMRALAGSTNTNEPFSGTVALTNTNVLTFSNGVLLKIQ